MAVVGACAIGLAVGLWLLWLSARAAITVALAEVHDGKLSLTRGGLSPRVLADLRDVVAHPPLARATIRILRQKGHARLEVHGDVGDHQRQQLRNVIGNVPLARLTRASRR